MSGDCFIRGRYLEGVIIEEVNRDIEGLKRSPITAVTALITSRNIASKIGIDGETELADRIQAALDQFSQGIYPEPLSL